MASVVVQTSSNAIPVFHGRARVIAGTREWIVFADGGNGVRAAYSDDNGATWSSPILISSNTNLEPCIVAYQDSGATWRLHIAYAGGNSTSNSLRIRSLHGTKVTTGAATISDFGAEATIDAGGVNAGISWPYMAVSNTGTNPRVWIVAMKTTAASTNETRVWYAGTGTTPDTAGNWSTTNFTNLGSKSNSASQHHGMAFSWKVSGVDKVSIVFGDPVASPPRLSSVTFDPTATTPTPGTVTNFGATTTGYDSWFTIPAIAGAVKDDYLIMGRHDTAVTDTWTFYKSVDGVTWTTPTGWSGLTMGFTSLTTDGTDFYMVHTATFGAPSTTDQVLKNRKITASSDAFGSAVTFSDSNGNPVCTPENTGTSALKAIYKQGTASLYNIRTDSVTIGPNLKTLSATQAQTPTVTKVTNKVLVC